MTFSILIETANLATADLAELDACLASLARQRPSAADAQEVVLFQTGDVPADTVERLRAAYGWLTVEKVDTADYGEMKELASRHATGNIVVWADSDCVYEEGWLAALLAPFDDPEVGVVRGETAIPIAGPYSLAMAIAFNFTRFSGESELEAIGHYHANNVAFRRSVLDAVPPLAEPALERAHFVVHSVRLRAAGHVIWRQPGARTWHAPPRPHEVPGRFVILGRDSVAVGPLVEAELAAARGQRYEAPVPGPPLDRVRLHLRAGWVGKARRRLRRVLADNPAYVAYLPVTLPVVAVAVACYYAGRGVALLRLPAQEALVAGRAATRPLMPA